VLVVTQVENSEGIKNASVEFINGFARYVEEIVNNARCVNIKNKSLLYEAILKPI